MLPGKLGNMMKRMQEMQENMGKIQEQLAQKKVTGRSGAGAVEIVLNGHFACQSVNLSPEALKEDKEMLEALIAAAFSDAINKVEVLKHEEIQKLTGGLNLPEGFKLPF